MVSILSATCSFSDSRSPLPGIGHSVARDTSPSLASACIERGRAVPVVGLDPSVFHSVALSLWVVGLCVVWFSCLVIVVAGVRR